MQKTSLALLRNLTNQSKKSHSFIPFKLPDLPFDYAELEPVISPQIMEVHHKKHHQAYVTNFNASVEQLLSAGGDPVKTVNLQGAIKFNGGGHINHSIFWTNLAPINKNGGKLPSKDSPLSQGIIKTWGSHDKFVDEFNKKAASIQGSGWAWLGYNKNTKSLHVQEMPNQDPLSLTGLVPLLGIDVWEHAYYLQYRNMRVDYLKEIWKVVNWKNVEDRFAEATK